MIATRKAKIFLADQRNVKQNNFFRSRSVFNEDQIPFGTMYLMNDDTLAGGQSLNMPVEETTYIVLLPIAGAINLKDSAGNETLVAAGQIQIISADRATSFKVGNPFKEDQVNFLQAWFKRNPGSEKAISLLSTFDINEFQNSLIQISPQRSDDFPLPFKISIGKFSGRGETIYHSNPITGGEVFVFVLEGAFEAEGCLLHARDGLALSNADEIEMEALSNDAMILVVETAD